MRQADERERWIRTSEDVAETLERFLRLTLSIAVAAVFAGAAILLVVMSRTSVGLGARLALAVAAMLMLGAIDSRFGWLAERRRPFWPTGPGESAYRRYQLLSGVLLLLSALVLGGLALLLP